MKTQLRLSDRRLEVDVEDVEYLQVEGQVFQVRIYRPKGSGPFPSLLDVHGGAWIHGTRTSDEHLNLRLAELGLLVAAIDFRQDRAHRYPDSVVDVNYGLRWLRANAIRWDGAASPLGVFGSSSGGYLAMLNALRPDHPGYASRPVPGIEPAEARPEYVMAGWPILDPIARLGFARQTGRQDLIEATGIYFQPESTIEEGNPQRVIERGEAHDLPPALILQGTADVNVTYQIQERFAAAYRAAGGDLQLERFPDSPHGFANRPGEDTDRAVGIVKAFITRQLAAAL